MDTPNLTPIYRHLTSLHGTDPLAERDVVAEAEAVLAGVTS